MGIHRSFEIKAPARVEVREFSPCDSIPVLLDMHPRCKDDLFADGETLALYANMSAEVLTADLDNRPAAVFGLISVGDRVGSWAMITNRAALHPILCLKTARAVMDYWLRHYDSVFSSIPAGDDMHRRWLEAVGCVFDDDPVNGRLYFERIA